MSTMDYDKSEPKYLPIIMSVIITIIVIIIMTVAIVYYFKGSLTIQESKNYSESGKHVELEQLNNYENDYLYNSFDDKITLDEAITITINRYN